MNPSAQPVTQNELNNLKRYLDTVWNALGIDIGFSKHFVDRVNDARNGKQITIGELQKIYTDVYMKWGKQILGLGKTLKGADEIEAILTKLSTNINIPFVIRWNRRTSMLDLHGITVMRKPNFRPNKPGEKQFKVESKVMLNNTPQSLTEAVKQIREKTERNNAIQQFVLEAFDVQFYNQLSWEQKQVFESVVAEVKELDEEELDELSKSTLASYIGKAAKSLDKTSFRSGATNDKNRQRYLDKKSDNRVKGITRAGDRLEKDDSKKRSDLDRHGNETNEEEEVNELSKKTLGSYIKKATDKVSGNAYRAGELSGKKADFKDIHGPKGPASKAVKRAKGIAKATDKLTKEENEEAVSEQYKIRIINNRTKQVFETKLYESLEQAETQKYRLGQKYPSGHTLTIVPVNESSLDELSKKTLGSYIKKASNDTFVKGTSGGIGIGQGQTGDNYKQSMKMVNKAHSRSKGIEKAADKLTKEETVDEEETEVSELSKSTLGSYIKKASFSKNRALKRMDSPKSPEQYSDASKEYEKRSAGLRKAQKEDVEEDVEVNELSKEQSMKRSRDRGLKNKKDAVEPKDWKTTTVSDFLKRRRESVKEDSSFLE